MSELSEMFLAQYAQQELIHGPLPEGRDEQRALAKDFIQLAGEELYDYLRATSYKSFTSNAEAPRSSRIIELVDAVKYILAAAWTERISAQEFFKVFMDKTSVVDLRFRQSMMTTKVCGFDIDGVIAEYGTWGPTEGQFIETGGVITLSPLAGAISTLRWLKEDGWSIVIVTARKRHIYQRLERDTHDWFAMHEIPYDRILWGYDKMEQIKAFGAEFSFFVEDSPKHAVDIADSGIPVFQMTHWDAIKYEGVYPVVDWSDLRNKLEQLFVEGR